MKIMVEHEITNDLHYCEDGDSGGWRTCCPYEKRRDKTGKRGDPIQRNLPRCELFKVWLDDAGPGHGPKKCAACMVAVHTARRLTIDPAKEAAALKAAQPLPLTREQADTLNMRGCDTLSKLLEQAKNGEPPA